MAPPTLARGALLALSLTACSAADAVLPAPQAPPPPPATPAPAPAPNEPRAVARTDGKVDLAVVHRIKEEAYRRSKVMDHLFWLTDVNGPRLTCSPGFKTAADWAVRTLTSFGAQGAHLEPWGKFGRAWTLQKFELSLVEPGYARLAGVSKAWSRGTSGAVTGPLVLAPLYPDREDRDDGLDLARLAARIKAYAEAQKGKLHGRFVLLDPARDLALPHDGDALRLEDKKLGELSLAPEHFTPEPWQWPLSRLPRDWKKRRAMTADMPMEVMEDFGIRRRAVVAELWRFLSAEGVLGVLTTDDRGDGALTFAESTGEWGVSRPLPPPAVVMPPEDYDRLARLAERNVPAKVRLEAAVTASERDEEAYNVVAELPGAGKRDELVMLGAHLDSWHAGTGATDNAAGSAVMLEAFRILAALHLPLERTVRLALWSGEEQGLHGSRAYVRAHFADPFTMRPTAEHAKVSAYFNLDNGTGKIRGVYLQGNDMARPLFEGWLAPFKDEGAGSITLRNTGGTDHLAFDAVGIPGFQFIQDPLDYGSRTHHSSVDVSDHLQAGDLMQASAIIASIVYDAANRPEMVPRKPLPAPIPPKTAP